MKTPKEKAKELVIRFIPHAQDTEHRENNAIWEEKVTEAKQCALICVDEILNVLTILGTSKKTEYDWYQIKQAINKL